MITNAWYHDKMENIFFHCIIICTEPSFLHRENAFLYYHYLIVTPQYNFVHEHFVKLS